MAWFNIFRDGPEFEARKVKNKFIPPDISIKQLHDAVPRHLFERSTSKSLFFIIRHILITLILHLCAQRIPSFLVLMENLVGHQHCVRYILRPLTWLCFWGWQGMAFAGIWCLGHEAGHNALSPYRWVNSTLGLVLHSFVLTPFYSWRATHRSHHKYTNDLERDETYIPPVRTYIKLLKEGQKHSETAMFEEIPIFTLFKLFIRQFFGFQLYLLHNRKGNPKYPPGTSHYRPSSQLFRQEERSLVVISDIAVATMLFLLYIYVQMVGWDALWRFYLLPWFFTHNWLVMFTYLQHSDPTVPYYRKDQWSFARGALATIDRPIFGWAGRFFLHNINTDHVAHHFFTQIPFYNLPAVTEAIKPVLGDYYNYDSTPVLHALWRSFTQCIFVDDEGDILFFKNRCGEAVLES